MDRIDTMQAALAVADAGGFTAAADRLGITPQQVSKHVKALETTLGVRLFDRTTRQVRISDPGRPVLDRCRRLIEDYAELEEVARAGQVQARGRLVVAAPVTFGARHVVPQLPSFHAAHPEVQIALQLTDHHVNLHEDAIDVAIRVGSLDDSALRARRLGETELVCVASPAYLRRAGRPKTPEALQEHAVVHDANLRAGPRWTFHHRDEETRVSVRPVVRVNNAEAALQLAEEGLGITLVPRFAAETALDAQTLVRALPARFRGDRIPIHLVYTQARLRTARVQAFADHMQAQLRL